MRYTRNISTWTAHIVDASRYGFTLCGQFYEKQGFLPAKDMESLRNKPKITCKRCLQLQVRKGKNDESSKTL
jgi:hypothetical protein